MSGPEDLTRWNRAGRARVRYVDGNAATYLELLREALRERLPAWTELGDAAPVDETASARLARLEAQLHGPRRDHAWELARVLSRSVHVLAEHLDAYANEGFLRTATQWENLRRLVAMLDYHPAPPASASTWLAVQAKPSQHGVVASGFQVKNAPEDGTSPAVFETLESITVDPALNSLRCAEWDKSQETLTWEIYWTEVNIEVVDGTKSPTSGEAIHEAKFPIDSLPDGVSVGTRGVLVSSHGEPPAIVVSVVGATASALTLRTNRLPISTNSLPTRALSQLRLLLAPKLLARTRLAGAKVILLDSPPTISVGSLVVWHLEKKWEVARIKALDGNRVALEGPLLPPVDAMLLLCSEAHAQDGGIHVPPSHQRMAETLWKADLEAVTSDVITTKGSAAPIADHVDESDIDRVYYLPKQARELGVVLAVGLTEIELKGDPGELTSGDWALVENEGSAVASQIVKVVKGESSVTLTLNPQISEVSFVRADFEVSLRSRGYDKNTDACVTSVDTASDRAVIPLAGAPPSALTRGRRLIITAGAEARAATIVAVDASAMPPTVTVTPAPTPDWQFPRHATQLLANVVPAGHGETRPPRILGSGDATSSSQIFMLEVDDIAFIADATRASGVRAALDVHVAGRTWTQVDTLAGSTPTDPHYTVRMTQDGHVEVGFGDGVHGRRLPSGPGNVRASLRVGTGAAGNLDPGQLQQIARPNPRVAAVTQPLPTSGGGDRETVDSLRTNAPASLLTLERAVSLRDFTHLAGRSSSVWQARAFAKPTGFGRSESVEVVIIPAGGSWQPALKASLESYLAAHTLPGVVVTVSPFAPVHLVLDVTVRVVSSAFDPEAVLIEVRAALTSALALERARLGAPIHRAAIFKIVESVAGVENATCMITEVKDSEVPGLLVRQVVGPDGTIRAVFPKPTQAIFLAAGTDVSLGYQEFTL